MTQTLAKHDGAQVLESVIIQGDLSKLTAAQRVEYYGKVCESLQLNPFTSPFEYIVLNGRLRLYAKKDATDQLRKIHGVSITGLDRSAVGDLYVVVAHARDAHGREDSDVGAVSIAGLKGEALANAMLKAVTKAKRRVTLSLCGLGMTDESEVDSIPGAYYPEETRDDVPVPTREQEVDDRDLVRSADERIWKRWLQLLDEAQGLGLNPVTLRLPVERDELKQRGNQLVQDISDRQEQIDREEAARIVAQAETAAATRDEDLDRIEVARQKATEGLR